MTTERLRERNQGIYEGGHWEDFQWKDFEGDNIGHAMPDGNVLFITHGRLIKALRALVEGITLAESIDLPIGNGTI